MDFTKVFPLTSWRRGLLPNGRPRNGQTSVTESSTTIGLDIRRRFDTIKPVVRAIEETQSVFVDQIMVSFSASDGKTYAFGNAGNVYRRSGTTWTKVYTDADGGITGAMEYTWNTGTVSAPVYTKYLIYTTKQYIHKITMANAGGTWTANVSETDSAGTTMTLAYTGGGNAAAIHWIAEVNGKALICDEGYIAVIDYMGVFNSVGLRLPQDFTSYGIYTIDNLGYIVANTPSEGAVFTWDTWSDSWINKIATQGIARFVAEVENQAVIQTGNGQLVKMIGSRTRPWLNLPRSAGGLLQRGTCKHDGMLYFVLVSSGTGGSNGCYVYSLGRKDEDHPVALMCEYGFNGLTENITSISSNGSKLSIFVYDSSGPTYKVYTVDTANELSSKHAASLTAYYEGIDCGDPVRKKAFAGVKIVLRDALPADCSFDMIYRALATDINEEAGGSGVRQWRAASLINGDTNATTSNTRREAVFSFEQNIGQFLDMQLSVVTGEGTGPGNHAEIEGIYILYSDTDEL